VERDNATGKGSRKISWGGLLTISLLLVLVIALIAAAAQYLYGRHVKREQIRQRQETNIELGLPRDFPSDLIPLYAGANLISSERGSAVSTADEPMDKWYVHAQSDDDKDAVYDYYHERMLAEGMRQTQYVSIPTGYGSDYADAEYVIEFIIERRPDADRLQIEITVYRVRD
jgi:hypothetical protein